MNKLHVLRAEILELDKELLCILSKRGQIVKKIGEEKIKLNMKINDSQRENELLYQLKSLNCGPYNSTMIRKIYIALFKISKELQEDVFAYTLKKGE